MRIETSQETITETITHITITEEYRNLWTPMLFNCPYCQTEIQVTVGEQEKSMRCSHCQGNIKLTIKLETETPVFYIQMQYLQAILNGQIFIVCLHPDTGQVRCIPVKEIDNYDWLPPSDRITKQEAIDYLNKQIIIRIQSVSEYLLVNKKAEKKGILASLVNSLDTDPELLLRSQICPKRPNTVPPLRLKTLALPENNPLTNGA